MKKVLLFFLNGSVKKCSQLGQWGWVCVGNTLTLPADAQLRMFGLSNTAQAGISLSHCMSAEGQGASWPCMFSWLDHRGLAREEDSMYHCPDGKPFRKCHLHGMCAANPEVWHAWVEFCYFCVLHKPRSSSHRWCNRPGIKWWYILLCLIVLCLGPFLTNSICFLFYAVAFSCT